MDSFFSKYRLEIIVVLGLGILMFLVLFLNNRLERLETYINHAAENAVPGMEQFATTEEGPLPAISYDLPKEINFAGEEVPMDRSDVRQQLDKEMQINIYFHSNTIFLIKRANEWLPQFEKILKEYGVPDDFKYLPLIESGLLNAVSPSDAEGFWQLLKGAGKDFGLEINREVDERYDPLKATVAACKYLKKSYDRFGNWTLVAASYNRGMNGLDRAIEKQKVKSYYDLYLNDETSRYVFRILAIKQIIEHPELYGFKISPRHLYQQDSVRYIDVEKTIPDLIDFALENGTTYKLLKLHNPWLRDDHLTVRKEKYRIAIPVNSTLK